MAPPRERTTPRHASSRPVAAPLVPVVDVRRPVWLLDVDGVVNGMGHAGWGSRPRKARVFAAGAEYELMWAPQLIARIRALLPVVEVQWATSWIDVGTHDLESAFAVPPLPHAYPADPSRLEEGRHLSMLHAEAKTRAALDVVASGRRLVWTDDDAIPAAGPQREALEAAGALLIAPDPRWGLREAHLRQIETFVAGG